jgi:hypothetical protein
LRNRILVLFTFCGLIASASAQINFSNLTYSVGGGPGIGRRDVASFVGNSPQAEFGVGKNFTRMFGMDAEYMYYDLDFRPNVIRTQALSDQSGRMQSFSLDGVVNVPRHIGRFAAYGIFGLGFYDRHVGLAHPVPVNPPTQCQPAWLWWDLTCVNNSITTPQILSSNSKVAGGFNYGGGLTYRLNHLKNAKLYLEWRYHRAYQSDGKTIVMPITVGLRW